MADYLIDVFGIVEIAAVDVNLVPPVVEPICVRLPARSFGNKFRAPVRLPILRERLTGTQKHHVRQYQTDPISHKTQQPTAAIPAEKCAFLFPRRLHSQKHQSAAPHVRNTPAGQTMSLSAKMFSVRLILQYKVNYKF